MLQETRPLRTGPWLDTVCCCCGGSCTATRNTLRPEGWSIVSWTAQSAEANLFRNIKNCLKLAFLWLRNFCRRPCLSGMLHFGSPVHLHQGRTSSRLPLLSLHIQTAQLSAVCRQTAHSLLLASMKAITAGAAGWETLQQQERQESFCQQQSANRAVGRVQVFAVDRTRQKEPNAR